jgi:hypothetical protein
VVVLSGPAASNTRTFVETAPSAKPGGRGMRVKLRFEHFSYAQTLRAIRNMHFAM